MAESERGSSPRTLNRLKVSRQEIPASTRIFVFEVCTTALFPRLPLASTDTDTPIYSQNTRSCCGTGSNFLVSRDFRASRPQPFLCALSGPFFASLAVLPFFFKGSSRCCRTDTRNRPLATRPSISSQKGPHQTPRRPLRSPYAPEKMF